MSVEPETLQLYFGVHLSFFKDLYMDSETEKCFSLAETQDGVRVIIFTQPLQQEQFSNKLLNYHVHNGFVKISRNTLIKHGIYGVMKSKISSKVYKDNMEIK